MARSRRKAANTSEIEIPEDRPIPELYEDYPDSWKRAYAYAANYSKGNGVKACVIFAEQRHQDDEFQDPEPDDGEE